MGYISDVRIIMSKNGYKKFKSYVKEYLDNYKPSEEDKLSGYTVGSTHSLLDNTDIFKDLDSSNEIYLGWDCVKW